VVDHLTDSRPASGDESPLLAALVPVSFAVMAILQQVAAAHGLSLTQLRLLAILRDRQPTMSELAEYLGLDRSSVSGLIDRAEKRGLARRIASDVDRRSSRVLLTRDGYLLAGDGSREIDARMDPLTRALTGQERDELARLLSRFLLSGRTASEH